MVISPVIRYGPSLVTSIAGWRVPSQSTWPLASVPSIA
jgi:hypothetical protein